VNTIPDETFKAYRTEGKPRPALQESWSANLAAAETTMRTLEEVGISMKSVTDQLLVEGVKKFIEPFEKLLGSIEKKRALLRAA
jgi:transaldolase